MFLNLFCLRWFHRTTALSTTLPELACLMWRGQWAKQEDPRLPEVVPSHFLHGSVFCLALAPAHIWTQQTVSAAHCVFLILLLVTFSRFTELCYLCNWTRWAPGSEPSEKHEHIVKARWGKVAGLILMRQWIVEIGSAYLINCTPCISCITHSLTHLIKDTVIPTLDSR